MGCTPASGFLDDDSPMCSEDEHFNDDVLVVDANLQQSARTELLCFHERYELLDQLGAGAFAKVYHAREAGPGIEVAVKVLVCPDDGKAPALRSAAERECTILRRLQGVGSVVKMDEYFADQEFCYIVMEKCPVSLLHYLERMRELTERTLVPVFCDMLSALADVHSFGIVHHDVKPDNFLCTAHYDDPKGHGQVKLCDFGLAMCVPRYEGDATRRRPTTGVNGTAPFMSPEILKHEPYDTKTDVWSMGALAYVLMHGEFPYVPAHMTSKGMKSAIAAGSPTPSWKPRFGTPLSASATSFSRSLLSRDMDMRPSAAEALAHPWLLDPCDDRKGLHGLFGSRPSLRPMLAGAKRAGAFCIHGGRSQEPSSHSSVDKGLAFLQLKHRGRACHMACRMDGKHEIFEVSTHIGSTDIDSTTSEQLSPSSVFGK